MYGLYFFYTSQTEPHILTCLVMSMCYYNASCASCSECGDEMSGLKLLLNTDTGSDLFSSLQGQGYDEEMSNLILGLLLEQLLP